MPKPLSRRRGLPLDEVEVRTLFQRVLDFWEKYRTWVILGGAAGLLAAAGVGLNSYLHERRAEAAAAALAQLRPQLSNPQAAAEALKGLEQFLKAHAGTEAALEAELFQAHLLYQTGKFEEALKAYQGLAANPKVQREAGLRALVMESLSYCQEALGKWAEAASTLKPLLEQAGGAYQGEVLRRYAMLSEQAGQAAEARQAWEKLLQRPPVPALVPYLKEKLGGTESKPASTPAPKP
jgi:predicted negative regulator of RcsB-dependent stress response